MALTKVQTPPITDPNKPGKSGLWSVWQNDIKNLFAAPTQQIVGINNTVIADSIYTGSPSANVIVNMEGLWARPSVHPTSGLYGNGIWIPASPFPQNGWGQLIYTWSGVYITGGTSTSIDAALTWEWFIDMSDTTNPFLTMTFDGKQLTTYNFWVQLILTFLNNNVANDPTEPWKLIYGGVAVIGSSVHAFPSETNFSGNFGISAQLGIVMSSDTPATTPDLCTTGLIQISKA